MISLESIDFQELNDVEKLLHTATENIKEAAKSGDSAMATQSYAQIVEVLVRTNLYPMKYVSWTEFDAFVFNAFSF